MYVAWAKPRVRSTCDALVHMTLSQGFEDILKLKKTAVIVRSDFFGIGQHDEPH